MNKLQIVVPSNLKNRSDFIRFAKSVDVSKSIKVHFVNQSTEYIVKEVYQFEKCEVVEHITNGIVPLSVARNIALRYIYSKEMCDENTLIMFVDDDAWFPVETIEMLLSMPIESICLRTIDPEQNKSFNGLSYTSGEVKGWHLIHDICSICLVVPLKFIENNRMFFNEKLGLGNEISQGEESLFIYHLSKKGLKIRYDEHYIYHPYKLSYNMKNYYSLSYFWAWGLTHVSIIFFIPFIKYLIKYSIGLLLTFRSVRYPKIFINVWKGAYDGMLNTKAIRREEL